MSVALALIGGCGLADPSPAPPVERARPDKASLYGDASLLPTRAGERARRELALAGELAAALELLEMRPAQIDVRLDAGPSVVVIATSADPEADASTQREAIVELSRALVPDLDAADVHLWLRPAPETPAPAPERPDAPPWALALACLGLGLSLGVTLERLRVRSRRAVSARI